MDINFTPEELSGILSGLDWKTWSPTISDEETGTPTTTVNLAQYYELAGNIYFKFDLTVDNAGGGGGGISFSLPFPADESASAVTLGCGREINTTGKLMIVSKRGTTDNGRITAYDNVNGGVWITGYRFIVCGSYRRT